MWFTVNVYDFRHIAFLFENMTAAEFDANATLSTCVSRNAQHTPSPLTPPRLFTRQGQAADEITLSLLDCVAQADR